MEAARYSSWQEVVVSNGKGRRVVHYYVKGAGGRADLAVVGREKSSRHMSYVVPNQFVRSLITRPYFLQPSPSSSSSLNSPPEAVSFKWRSRREVIDWLSSLVSDPIGNLSSSADRFGFCEDYETEDMLNSKFSSEKTKHPSREFQWLGAPWLCRKRKSHYRSFCKNGVTILVHDFVFVMVEENKRRVAYVDDLYEDSRSNNMVVVRWFHEVDELGIVLPPDANDREIFFSLCLQDFSVECIDGLAAVLSPQHFEQFQNEARHTSWRPLMCHRQIDNDDIKPFDITQLQGYWSQEIVRSMSFTSPFKLRLKRSRPNASLSEQKSSDVSVGGSKRKHLLHTEGGHDAETSSVYKTTVCSKSERNAADTLSGSALPTKELFEQKFQQQFHPGTHVEILSQDSGIRGCWFRCVIIKRHRNKVKLRYQDIQDSDESGDLVEWVLLSKIAGPDKLGIHHERSIVRPKPLQSASVCHFHVGAIVDAWWHDGWWEGIVLREESIGQLHVYFPGENCSSTFSEAQLRQSQDWISNKWNAIEDRVDIVNSKLSGIKDSPLPVSSFKGNLRIQMVSNSLSAGGTVSKGSSSEWEVGVPDLTKDYQFKPKWSSSKKRKHRREVNPKDASALKKRHCAMSSSSCQGLEEHILCGNFVLPKSLTVDHENCKIGSDPLFSTPMALSNLVMSQ